MSTTDCAASPFIIHDYIIAGSGIAGNTCAYLLQKMGYSGIILEQESSRKEKICGGGIPWKALSLLKSIGMDLSSLYDSDVSIVNGDCTFWGDKETLTFYDSNEFSMGSRRCIFDNFLLNQAQKIGADIAWGQSVKRINKMGSCFLINGYKSKRVILAVGARGLDGCYTQGQSVGISSQIYGVSSLNSNLFYFFYYDQNRNHYFWIFPIGEKLWNVGLWYRYPESSMKRSFNSCWDKYVKKFFKSYTIISPPKGDFCGHIDLNKIASVYAIGDCAGCNNSQNGGGIYRAIKSAIHYSQNMD